MCLKRDISSFTASTEDYKLFVSLRSNLKSLATDLYEGKLQPHQLHSPTVERTFKELMKSYSNGSGKKFSSLEPGTKDWNKLSATEANLFTFSALKNYNFLEAAKSFRTSDFAEYTKQFDEAFRLHYERFMAVEREHVKRVGEAQKEWEDYEQFANTHPYITYHTAEDERVRPQHAAWNKITLPFNHPFWKTHFPPNGYNCRCYTAQDFEIEEGDIIDPPFRELPKPDEGFRTNFGVNSTPFAQEHSYFKIDFNRHHEVNSRICEMFKSYLKGFIDIDDKVRYHPSIEPKELQQNIKDALWLSDKINESIILNPVINTQSGFKNPDFIIWGTPADFKATKNVELKHLQRAMFQAAKQNSEIVVIEIPEINERAIARLSSAKISEMNSGVKQLWIRSGEELMILTRDPATQIWIKNKSLK